MKISNGCGTGPAWLYGVVTTKWNGAGRVGVGQKHPKEDQLPVLVEQFPVLGFLVDAVGERDLLPDWEALKDAYDKFFHHTLPEWVADTRP